MIFLRITQALPFFRERKFVNKAKISKKSSFLWGKNSCFSPTPLLAPLCVFVALRAPVRGFARSASGGLEPFSEEKGSETSKKTLLLGKATSLTAKRKGAAARCFSSEKGLKPPEALERSAPAFFAKFNCSRRKVRPNRQACRQFRQSSPLT